MVANNLLWFVSLGRAIPGSSEDPEQKILLSPSYPGQIQDFIFETEKTIKKGFRVLGDDTDKKNGGRPFCLFKR